MIKCRLLVSGLCEVYATVATMYFTDIKTCIMGFSLQESVDKANVQTYQHLLKTVNWFFFDLFLLGYVEDPATGQSFIFTGGMAWAVYIEVYRNIHVVSQVIGGVPLATTKL